ncbi:deoxyribonuclease [Cercopithecine alphaherpesvirus 2]|uniref:Deoxyribonuclease n=1 Tax=Cercopithecine alphaherpesvirus 2 TaxID=10317 RepID=Q5Y0U1_9ALPH|nr:deoxyribonuclease [Cercopithecine alphaherpesvirus 2]AAU88077.1 deoxyribonuclease [Cercopithecine alphaherpesvirus 2]
MQPTTPAATPSPRAERKRPPPEAGDEGAAPGREPRDPARPPKRPRPDGLPLAAVYRPASPPSPGRPETPPTPDLPLSPRGTHGVAAPAGEAEPRLPSPPSPASPSLLADYVPPAPDADADAPDVEPWWSAVAIPDALPPHVQAETFERHLRGLLRGVRRPLDVEPLGARLGYLFSLATALEEAGMVDRGLGGHLFRLSRRAAAADPRPLMAFFEAATQNQAESQLWALLRRGLTTASTLKWGPRGPCFSPRWLKNNDDPRLDFPSSAVMFGRTNEPAARALLFRYCVGRTDDRDAEGGEAGRRFVFCEPGDAPVAGVHACGVLVDAHTGMVGASLDILVCPRDRHGCLSPTPGTPLRFYEVKCRAKYAFDPADAGDPVVAAHRRLVARRSPADFRAFLRSIARPGVRYFAPGQVPGPEEALVSDHAVWADARAGGEKRRCPALDRALVGLNSGVASDVLLFGDPDPERRTVSPLVWSSGDLVHREPIFANPRHPNFKQILVQAYVLASHFPECPLHPHLVTFIGRHRTPDEEGLSLRLGDAPASAPAAVRAAAGASILPDQAVPVALIITPVRVDAAVYDLIRRNSRLAFDETLARLWASRAPASDPAVADGTSS